MVEGEEIDLLILERRMGMVIDDFYGEVLTFAFLGCELVDLRVDAC